MLSAHEHNCLACGETRLGRRGRETVVAAGLNQPWSQSACAGCLACVAACPTGALTEKLLHFSGEQWDARKIYL